MCLALVFSMCIPVFAAADNSETPGSDVILLSDDPAFTQDDLSSHFKDYADRTQRSRFLTSTICLAKIKPMLSELS